MTLEQIKARLEMLGYNTGAQDDALLDFIMRAVKSDIRVTLNIEEIPADIEHIAIDKVVGEFLLNRKNMGQDVGIDLDAAVKAISEGDTNVQFDTDSTPESKLDALIRYMLTGRDAVMMAYRSIRW